MPQYYQMYADFGCGIAVAAPCLAVQPVSSLGEFQSYSHFPGFGAVCRWHRCLMVTAIVAHRELTAGNELSDRFLRQNGAPFAQS